MEEPWGTSKGNLFDHGWHGYHGCEEDGNHEKLPIHEVHNHFLKGVYRHAATENVVKKTKLFRIALRKTIEQQRTEICRDRAWEVAQTCSLQCARRGLVSELSAAPFGPFPWQTASLRLASQARHQPVAQVHDSALPRGDHCGGA